MASRSPRNCRANRSTVLLRVVAADCSSCRLGFFDLERGDGLIERPDRGRALESIGSSARQQLVEQYAQGVEVAARIDRIAAQQLGTRIVRRQRSAVDTRQRRLIRLFSLQQPGDAEIQQPHLPGLGDQNVRGLEIPVNDLLFMGVLHGLEHLQEKPQALGYPEPV